MTRFFDLVRSICAFIRRIAYEFKSAIDQPYARQESHDSKLNVLQEFSSQRTLADFFLCVTFIFNQTDVHRVESIPCFIAA